MRSEQIFQANVVGSLRDKKLVILKFNYIYTSPDRLIDIVMTFLQMKRKIIPEKPIY
jgi:hypothetical protein